MSARVGIGMIGTGFARRVQIPAFLACEDARIVSVASGTFANAEATASEARAGHFTADWRETAAHPGVDLVCITTPPSLHREMALFAIEHGKHVLCEKPMAMDLVEAVEMCTAASRKPILALIDHELRFQPGRQLARAMLRDGAIGRVHHAKYIFQAPHRGDPALSWNWWSDIEQGGGALGAINSHVIDSFNWFLGSCISSVFCQLKTTVKQRRDEARTQRPVTSDDEAHMLLRFADSDLAADATGLVSVSMTEYPKYTNRIEFYGERGALRVGPRGTVYAANLTEKTWDEVPVDIGTSIEGVPDTGFSRGFMAYAPVLVDAISKDQTSIEHAATFDDGKNVQRVLDAARRSDRERRAISIE